MMDYQFKGPNAMVEDGNRESLAEKKDKFNNQRQLDTCAEGFEVTRLSTLMGSEAAYTTELEDLYGKMLAKIEGLSRLVEETNAKVLEQVIQSWISYLILGLLQFDGMLFVWQETNNMKLRQRVAGLEAGAEAGGGGIWMGLEKE